MYVKNFNGDEFTLQATLTNSNEVNGNQSLEGTIEYTKVNGLFIEDIDRLWSVYDHKDVGYKIQLLNRQGKGNKMVVTFTAEPLFFDYMDTNSIMDSNDEHFRYDGSYTARNAFKKIFDDTPFDFSMTDSAPSVEWENFGGGESKLETFKRALERYKYEFEIRGSTIFLENQIGRDMSIQYRHRLNASNIQQEIDASSQITAIKGYGNFGESQADEDGGQEDYRDARLKRTYISPLAAILGERWGFYEDGRDSVRANMDKKLKEIVDSSLIVSVAADIVNLSSQGYPIDQSKVGDRVFLIDERINFNEEVRIVNQSITRNFKGEVIDANVTFGDEELGKRHQSNINSTVKNWQDIISGKKEIPLSHLDRRVKEISAIINGNTNSVFKYMPNGVVGWNGDDPNYMTKYVGDAIGFSTDGGNTYGTAMSADLGIVADYITTGTLRAILIEGVEIYGSYIEGTDIVGGHIEQSSGSRKIIMEKGRINSYTNNDLSMSFGQYSLDFYNRENDQIGSFGTVTADDDPTKKGLALTVDNDFLNIGVRVGSLIRPILRSSLYNNLTTLAGPFSGALTGSKLRLFGNRRLVSDDTPFEADLASTDQPTILLDQGSNSNDNLQYFGGANRRNDAVWQVRYNHAADGWTRRITADSEGVEIGGSLKNRDGERYYLNKEGGGNLDSEYALRAGGMRTVPGAENIYLGVINEVRVTSPFGTGQSGGPSYNSIRASNFRNSSSGEYKMNVEPMGDVALEKLNNLEVVTYDFIKDGGGNLVNTMSRIAPKKKTGFISENSPDIATEDGKAVELYEIISLNTKAIQELSNKVDEMEGKLKQ